MNELTKMFEGHQLRMIEDKNEVHFLLRDVCDILSLGQVAGLVRRLDDEVISNHPIKDSLGRSISAKFVNEDGLYDAVLESRKPEAKKFRKWITSDVLPAIRKHGGYLTPQKVEEALINPDTIILLATQLKEERAKRELEKPKVLFAEALEISTQTILIGELAKLLKQNGVDIGQKRLFSWMRENGYLIRKQGDEYNNPTQRSMDLALFEIKKSVFHNNDGSIRVTKTTKVTGKGQSYFINKFIHNLQIG